MIYNTKLLDCSDSSLSFAADLLSNGEIVGIPTETVYGLAANALDTEAVEKIFIAKGRPQDNPLIVHISDFDMIKSLVKEIPKLALECAEKFWPGPLTMVLPKSDKIPLTTSGGLNTVGIRLPSNKTARKLIAKCGFPLAAPSANLSGSPSPTKASHVFDDMNGRIPCIIDDGNSSVGVESTVITFENNSIRLLRPGFISVSDLKEVCENVLVDKGVTESVGNDTVVASPGMKYKHYSPKADITIIDADLCNFRKFVSEHISENLFCMTFTDNDLDNINCNFISYGNDDETQAKMLFDTLRELDKQNAKKVYARCPSKKGIGLAVYNRLLRAAGFQVIKL